MVKQSLPIEGSLAEKYLKEHRGIHEFLSAEVRYLPAISTRHESRKTQVPALLCIAKDNAGKVNHVQVIRLDPDTGSQDKKSEITKQTYGVVNGIGIELNKKGTGDKIFLAEGVETGLSIVEAEKTAKVCALLSKSNFANVSLNQLESQVVLCLDNDGKNTFKDNTLFHAVERLTKAGKQVSIIIPDNAGTDFNDTLKTQGVSGVTSLMNNK